MARAANSTPKGEPRHYFCNLPDELLWDRQQARGPNEPWHPVDDCMELVGRVLDPDRFDPAAWPDMGLPDPAWELKRLDPEGICQTWLRSFLNLADAEDFKSRLEGLTGRWEGWKAAAVQRKPDLDATTDLTSWLDEPDNRDLWRELLDIRGDARDTCAYLRTLAGVIRAKEAKRNTENATAGSGPSVPGVSGDDVALTDDEMEVLCVLEERETLTTNKKIHRTLRQQDVHRSETTIKNIVNSLISKGLAERPGQRSGVRITPAGKAKARA